MRRTEMAQFGNVFVYPVIRPLKSQSASVHHEVDQDAMFLVVANGPEQSGWDLLEERVSAHSFMRVCVFVNRHRGSIGKAPG